MLGAKNDRLLNQTLPLGHNSKKAVRGGVKVIILELEFTIDR